LFDATAARAALHRRKISQQRRHLIIVFPYLTTTALELERPAEGGILPAIRQRKPTGLSTFSSS
jgi:hypothetical protein